MLKERSEIITSPRTFGIELELGQNGENRSDDLYRAMDGRFNMTRDASMTVEGAVEVVSPVLLGSKGAKEIIKLCYSLKSMNFHGDHISIGMHTHIGAKDFLDNNKVAVVDKEGLMSLVKDRKTDILNIMFVNECTVKAYTGSSSVRDSHYHRFGNKYCIKKRRRQGFQDGMLTPTTKAMSVGVSERIGGTLVKYVLVDQVSRLKTKKLDLDKNFGENEIHERITDSNERERAVDSLNLKMKRKYDSLVRKKRGMFVVQLNDSLRLNKVKSLLYFYLAFDDVFTHMVSPSRRFGNSFCAPLRESFELDTIEKVGSFEEFKSMWYKEGNPDNINRSQSDHYNGSRYHNLNLHSLFGRYNTIELRAHGGTTDASKVLLWTALHQEIVDKIGDNRLSLEEIKAVVGRETDVKVKAQKMLALLELPTHLDRYVKRLLSFFSDINLE